MEYNTTIGVDVSDRTSKICVLRKEPDGARRIESRNDLKLKGLRIAMRGGKIAKKKARIAVARGMAVTAVALLLNPDAEYVPLSEEGRKKISRCPVPGECEHPSAHRVRALDCTPEDGLYSAGAAKAAECE